jgi:hypothetical protein
MRASRENLRRGSIGLCDGGLSALWLLGLFVVGSCSGGSGSTALLGWGACAIIVLREDLVLGQLRIALERLVELGDEVFLFGAVFKSGCARTSARVLRRRSECARARASWELSRLT